MLWFCLIHAGYNLHIDTNHYCIYMCDLSKLFNSYLSKFQSWFWQCPLLTVLAKIALFFFFFWSASPFLLKFPHSALSTISSVVSSLVLCLGVLVTSVAASSPVLFFLCYFILFCWFLPSLQFCFSFLFLMSSQDSFLCAHCASFYLSG